MKIIIPAAGDGTRFADAGYEEPKPLIDVLGKPMVIRVADNVVPRDEEGDHFDEDELIIITQEKHHVDLKDYWGNGRVLAIDQPTEGAVCTILVAEPFLKDDQPIIIANCDQLVDFDVNDFIATDLDGRIVTFPSNKDHHSYVLLDDNGIITDIKEKEVISNHAVTGVYFFKSSAAFIRAAKTVIDHDRRTKGEFYVSSVIDQMIKDGLHLTAYQANSTMLGTPEELQHFLVAASVAKTL